MPKNQNSIIKVIGVGGGGGNAVNNMFLQGINGVDFVICNTDVQALEMSPVPNKVRLGTHETEGLGAGANPEVGRNAAMESIEDVREILKNNTKMVFITAGMGGGTGTGAAPVIAKLAKEMGILTVGIVTLPFRFEGKKRTMQAMEGIRMLEKAVDTILVINNNNLTQIFGNNVTMKKAFEEADQVLCNAAKGIAEIITLEGYINVDFADVSTIMRDGGTALMGTARFSGEDRAIMAAEEAISSPLLDNVSIHGASKILVNITASEDSFRLDETTTIVEYIQEAAGEIADVIFGCVYDANMGEELSVTVIATGFGEAENRQEPEVKKEVVKEDFTISNEELTFQPGLFEVKKVSPSTQEKRDEVLEERARKLKEQELDFHNPDELRQLEDVPAYMRKQKQVEEEEDYKNPKLSRISLDEITENKYRLNDNNSFLHDNVD